MSREKIYEITKDADGIDCYIKRGELVRCKDCKHFNNGDCTEMPKLVSEEDYCSFGEER